MATQTYANHRHQPRLTFIGFLFLIIGIIGFLIRGTGVGGHVTMAVGLGGFAGAILTLLLISRAYTTTLQDRIIRLEMRMRCASLLTPEQQTVVSRLEKPQLVALRFASDAELGPLAERAAREHLTADQIKRAITNWLPDLNRT